MLVFNCDGVILNDMGVVSIIIDNNLNRGSHNTNILRQRKTSTNLMSSVSYTSSASNRENEDGVSSSSEKDRRITG